MPRLAKGLMRTLRVSMELSTRTFVDLAIMFAFVPTRAIWFPFASVIVMIFAHTFVVFPSAPVLIAVAQLPVVPPFALVIIMIIDMHMPVEFPFGACVRRGDRRACARRISLQAYAHHVEHRACIHARFCLRTNARHDGLQARALEVPFRDPNVRLSGRVGGR